MKTVVVRPEKCIGCKQCMIRCAETHSKSKNLFTAIYEDILAKPRIHIGVGPGLKPFPNKCLHCEPAPCQEACMPGAIRSDIEPGLKIVDPSRCINCGMCSMVCPYYAIRYYPHPDVPGLPGVAIKCDGCYERVREGLEPACVEACLTGALVYGEVNEYMQKGTHRLAHAVYGDRL